MSGRWRIGVVLAALFLAALAPGTAPSQTPDGDLRVEARIEPSEGVTDTQPIQFSLRISGERIPDWSPPALPPLENLRVVSGPYTSTNFEMVNFRYTRSVATLTYVLLAEGPGPARIPAIEIAIGDRTYRTEPIRFDVARGRTRPAPLPGPGGPGSAPGSPGGTGPAPDGPADEARQDLDVYLRARIDTTEPWVGQPVRYQLEMLVGEALLDEIRVSNLQWISTPSFSNFWVEDDTVDEQGESYRETVAGRPMRIFPLVRKMLIPTRAGSFSFEPHAIRFRVGPRDAMFGGLLSRSVQVVRRTDPMTVDVRELPREGRPDGFSGAVGTFRLESAVDRDAFAVDEALALSVTVVGDGFLRPVPAPELPSSPQLRVFEPKVEESATIREGRLESRKSWEWILVPLSAGEVELPGVVFPYFDSDSGTYELLRSEARTVSVSGEGTGPRRGSAGPLRAERQDIRYIKTSVGPLRERVVPVHLRAGFRLAAVAPLALAPALVLWGRWRSRLRGDRGRLRARRAAARARKRWDQLRKRGSGLDPTRFHEDLGRILVDYVADRFDRHAAGLTYDVADGLLAGRAVPEDVRVEFRRVLEACDFARYVPSSAEEGRREETLARARALIDRLEGALR